MATAFALCSGPIAGACSLGKGRVLVSVQGDGVSCYDVSSQKPVASWALGGTDQEFSSGAVYDYDTNLLFAPLRPRGSGGKSGSVLAWSADDTVGTITTLARPMHLPSLHTVFSLSRAPEGEEEEAAAAAAEEADAAAVDGSGAARAGAVAVFASGGAALCGGGEVVAEVEEARGQHTVAAAFQPAPYQAPAAAAAGAAAAQQARQQGTLVLVHSEPRSGAVAASAYHVRGGRFEAAAPPAALTAPAAGARAVAAAATPERTAVLWSDGTVAVYAVPGDKRPLGPAPGLPVGPGVPIAQRRLAGFRLPAGKQQQKGSGGKKRGPGGEPEAAAGGVSMAAIGDKQVAVVSWATSADGATVLRLVVLETTAACVQLAQDWTAADVGLAVLDPSKPVQVDHLGGSSKQLAISVGTAVLVATLAELKPPTVANLLGALALDRAALSSSSGGGGGGKDSLLKPAAPAAGPLLGSTAAVNPAALAAARVLHADEVAALSAPFGGAARPMQLRLQLEAAEEPGQWLVPAREVTWEPADPAAAQQLAQAEQRVWQEVAQPPAAALASDAALQEALAPLLKLRQSSGLALSPRLVSRLLMLAAERQHWRAAAALVATQPPSLLGEVPGLAAAAADAGQFELLEQLLLSCCDVPAGELTALLRVLLSPPSTPAAREGQAARHSAACAAAEAAAEAAAAAGAQQGAQQPAAAKQQQQQQQQDRQQAAARSSGRRRRRKSGAADASDSDAEEAAAAAAADPGMPGGREQQGADGPALFWLEAAGAREAAVATCCRAGVHGFEAADCCLHALVARPLRAAELLAALRPLGAAQALRLLRYLATLLRNLTSLVGPQLGGWDPPLGLPAGAAQLPRLPEALAWANATLDANLVALSMEPEALPLLGELSSLVEAQVADTRPLLRLAGLVEHALQQRPLPQSGAATAAYSIQWLDLRVAPPDAQQQQRQQAAAAAAAMQQ
ncbi:hypothetical protein ABPG75_008900 [Micractinium tetrahymenae]